MDRILRLRLAVPLLFAFAGCGRSDGLHRVEVHGSVAVQGQPVAQGLVTFRPARGSKGPAAGTSIMDGKFQIPVERGPTTGPHEVEIKIVSAAAPPAVGPDSALANRTPQQLKAFSESVQVADGVNQFDFNLQAAPASTPKSSK